MLVKQTSRYYLQRTRAASKEIEFDVQAKAAKETNIIELFPLTIALIADFCTNSIHNGIEIDNLETNIEGLYFSSKFFDSYLNLDENTDNKDYILLIGAVAYYFCNRIGSSTVLAGRINKSKLRLSQSQIELVIFQMLTNSQTLLYNNDSNIYAYELNKISANYEGMLNGREDINIDFLNRFRKKIYNIGNDRDLLFVDIMYTLFLLKKENSIINMLPQYSSITKQQLIPIINDNHFVKELWQSQREMCKKGMFNYKSGVIQLPTGTGKTKAISMVVYSMFNCFDTGLSIILLPFRALCREVYDDLICDLSFASEIHINALSDLIQSDYSIEKLYNPYWKSVIVTTPEKLSYVLKHDESIISGIRQVIFDEGHLFDDYSRGARYELLLTEILNKIDFSVQKIFISAIIPNVEDVNKWLTKDEGFIIKGNTITSVEKFSSIIKERKDYFTLSFLNKDDFDKEDYFVPKFFERKILNKLGKERQVKYFPGIREKNDVSIACLLKTVKNATTALYCGRKNSADKILNRIIEINKRGYDISNLYNYSNAIEVSLISNQIKDNYGDSNDYYLGSVLGAFIHHGGISDGIRSSIEYALRKKKINNVLCTSTLAQGVNLPIKYLIVSNLYQSDEIMKVRDFHNLIGRTGRPGIYTEGTIILADPTIRDDDYKWAQYKRLLNQNNSEICSSRILELVSDITIKKNTYNFTEWIFEYYADKDKEINSINLEYAKRPLELRKIHDVLIRIIKTLGILENYIAVVLQEDVIYDNLEELILSNSLAFNMASDEQKQALIRIVKAVIGYLKKKFGDSDNIKAYVNSMLNIEDFTKIENNVHCNLESFTGTYDEVFHVVMKTLYTFSDNRYIQNITDSSHLDYIAGLWVQGVSYNEILNNVLDRGFQLSYRHQFRNYKLSDIINICDNGFGYSSSIIINCISEIILNNNSDTNVEILDEISKKLKYGLPFQTDIYVYELGFNDRVIAQKIHNIIGESKSLD